MGGAPFRCWLLGTYARELIEYQRGVERDRTRQKEAAKGYQHRIGP
jgi:hypothetical protein